MSASGNSSGFLSVFISIVVSRSNRVNDIITLLTVTLSVTP